MISVNIPAELERRIRVLETPGEEGEDFDASSWFWLLVLGLVLPIAVLVLGWVA
ncbi:hypothetical protein QFZ88_005339 [Mesorhizobium sp. YL-MeA3-2017]|jgi:hypothetical protein|nr:hypothetical protein [Mesorhizobium sp. YL-MeA3-2017]